jgi:serine phosphatase RsbU (regulator of sigma subunit)
VVEGWTSFDLSLKEEEQRWLAEGGWPSGGNTSSTERDPAPPVWEDLTRNLTWRSRVAEAQERERIEQELRVARQIQRSLLPEVTPELYGWQLATYYRPAREVGGDFYAVLNPNSGHLVYANAGHDLPYLHRNGETEELMARGMPLGLIPGMFYEEKETTLHFGEAALFYSDGLVEAHNPEGELFGFPRLRALIAEHGEARSLGDPLLEELYSFTGEGWEQEDDITLLSLRHS